MASTTPTLPQQMRAAQVSSFGTPSVITVETIATPAAPSPTQLLLKVEAVSLSPSDYRTLTGACSLVKKPPKGKFPYTPGGDISGTVFQTHQSETDFKVGDRVFATWDTLGFGGLAEFVLVEKKLVYAIPEDVSFIQAAAMADSPVNAMLAVEDAGVNAGDRVLILGGSGGVGTSAIQLARRAGAVFVATTTTDADLVTSLGADLVINYEQEKWYERHDLRSEKLDVIIDVAEGESAWLNCGPVLKSWKDGGRFVAGVVNEWHIEIRSIFQMVAWIARPLWRMLKTRLWSGCARYTMLFPAPRGNSMERFLELRKELRIVVDKRGPWEFSTEGVRDAFEVMIGRKGHGKVVIGVGEQGVAEGAQQ